MKKIDKIKVQLPDSVKDPKASFRNSSEAIQFYSKKLEVISSEKNMSLDELKKASESYEFVPEESFEILGIFDSIRALKALRN